MDQDPIADNQTELMINKLLNRNEGDPLLNQAVAALLLSVTKMISEVATIKRDLWKPDELDKKIDQHHSSACIECPTRKLVEYWDQQCKTKDEDKRSWVQAIFSKDGLLIILVLLFALMSIYSTIGKEGYQTVTHTAEKYVPHNQGAQK